MASAAPTSAGVVVYCCVAKGGEVVYSYGREDAAGRGFAETAAMCLELAPPLHRHYFRTVGARTAGLLTADGHTFLAVTEPSIGSAGTLSFLERIREASRGKPRDDALLPIIRKLLASLENAPRAPSWLTDLPEAAESSESSLSSQAPLLGASSRAVSMNGESSAIDIEAPSSSESGGGGGELPGQRSGRLAWRRTVRIVVAADIALCLLLFGVWLAVCRGFQCV